MENPFITGGYAGPEYFCDRKQETEDILRLLENGNNIALISPRRYGKSDLLRHCFAQKRVAAKYYTFIVDIYATNSLQEMTSRLGKAILDELKPKGRKAWSNFLNALSSVRSGISYDAAGVPSWTMEIGAIKTPDITLDEIFSYLQQADKPCFVAIDEFQQILRYEDKNIEATLRTYVQYCSNAHFIFSGSHREMMGSIFTSSARPFYQSVMVMNLQPIPLDKYAAFCDKHFRAGGKGLDAAVTKALYVRFDAVTFYLQKVMNLLYMFTERGETCTVEAIDKALDYILDFSSNTYEDLIYQLPEKQKITLLAIAKEERAANVTSEAFVKKYSLVSASSVSSAVKGLMEKGLVTANKGTYQVYDLFLGLWLRERYY